MSTNKRYWLGNPEGRVGMLQLGSVNAGTGAPIARGEQVVTLINGASTVVHNRLAKRSWSFQRDWMTADDAAILNGLYLETYDSGPFRLLDPSEVNLLDQEASTFGRASGDLSYWAPQGATVLNSVDRDSVGPALDSCIPEYGGLVAGVAVAADDTLTGFRRLPYVSTALDFTFSVYGRYGGAASGLSAHLRLSTGAGGVANGSVVPLSGAWQRLSVHAIGLTEDFYLDPSVVVDSVVGATTLQLCGPQVEINTVPSTYRVGLGIGVVNFAPSANGGALGRTTPRTGFRSTSWALVEV